MYLQKLINISIDAAHLSPQSRLYRTGSDKVKLWHTYLQLATTLNASDENMDHFNCTTCRKFIESMGTACYYDVATDADGNKTSNVVLRSLLWEPDTAGLDPKIVEALATLRDLAIADGVVKSAIDTAGKTDYGIETNLTDTGNTWEHLHIKDLACGLMSKHSVLHPSEIQARVGRLNLIRGKYNNLDAVKKELKYMTSNTKIPETICNKVSALVTFLERVAVKADTHNVLWLTASNPALVEVTKFHNTPVGMYLTEVLSGGDEKLYRKIIGDKYLQTTKREIDPEVDESAMVRADMLLTELGLNESLPRDVLQHNFVGLPITQTFSEPEEPETNSGPMGNLVNERKPKADLRVIEIDTIGQSEFVEMLPTLSQLNVFIDPRAVTIVYTTRQSNREVKSLLRNGDYYEECVILETVNHDVTAFKGWAKVKSVMAIDGRSSLLLDEMVVARPNVIPTPLFPDTIVPELHGIRSQIIKYSGAVPLDITPDTQLAFSLRDEMWKVHPRIRFVKADEPDVMYETTITHK